MRLWEGLAARAENAAARRSSRSPEVWVATSCSNGLDHAELDTAGGMEAGRIVVQKGLESFGRFLPHQSAAGE
jgi:hypothetical protein